MAKAKSLSTTSAKPVLVVFSRDPLPWETSPLSHRGVRGILTVYDRSALGTYLIQPSASQSEYPDYLRGKVGRPSVQFGA